MSEEKTADIQEQGVVLEKQFGDLLNFYHQVAETGRQSRLKSRQDEFDSSSLYKTFMQVSGEWSRADNVGCGINGEADHEYISTRFEESAIQEQNEQKKQVCLWMAKVGQQLAESRGLIKELLIADQAINKKNYTADFFQTHSIDSGVVFDSSLGDIPEKNLSETALNHISHLLEQIALLSNKWLALSSTLRDVGLKHPELMVPGKPELSITLITKGSPTEVGETWVKSLDELSPATEKIMQILKSENCGNEEKSQAYSAYMEIVTHAQALIEAQHYFVGVILMRASVQEKLSEPLPNID